jgi:type III secretion protein C
MSKLSIAAWVFTALAVGAQVVEAAEPHWPSRTLTLQAQEQPLGDFLRDLFNAADMRVLPSESVSGRISGRFADKPEKIFTDIVKAYGLLPYYDGTVMHISTAGEIQSKSIHAQPAEIDGIVRKLVESGLVDRYQSVQVQRGSGAIKVRGAPEFITDVEELLRKPKPRATSARPIQLESAAPHTLVFRSFPLKYASAADLSFYQNGSEVRIPGVASLLRSMVGIGGSLIAMSSGPDEPRNHRVQSIRDQGSPARADGTEPGLRDASVRDPGDRYHSPPSAYVSDRGNIVRIEADPNLNAVMVRDYGDAMPLYQDMIAQLDKEPQLIEIQVTIVDIDRGKLTDLGVDWRYDDQRNSVSAGGGNVAQQDGGLLLNTVLGNASQFLANVHALAKTGSAQIVSRPQVLTLSNLEAVLSTDQSFFVRVAGNEDVDLFNVSVGTALRVVPHVVGEAGSPQIRLRVAIEDGSLSPDQSVDNIPIVEKSSLNTQAIIYNGQSLLLGGLVRDESTKNTTKVPLLGDVPGVGRLFKRTTNTSSRQERLFLIQPRIVKTSQTVSNTAARSSELQTTAQRPQAYLDGF